MTFVKGRGLGQAELCRRNLLPGHTAVFKRYQVRDCTNPQPLTRMKRLIFLLLLQLPAAAWATPAPTLPADTILLRHFLVAVADTSISDSVLVTRFMCADRLFRRGDEQVAIDVAALRLQLCSLRKHLRANRNLLKYSSFLSFDNLPVKPPFTLRGGNTGAYVLVAEQQVLVPFLVHEQRIASFTLAHLNGEGWFYTYCTDLP